MIAERDWLTEQGTKGKERKAGADHAADKSEPLEGRRLREARRREARELESAERALATVEAMGALSGALERDWTEVQKLDAMRLYAPEDADAVPRVEGVVREYATMLQNSARSLQDALTEAERAALRRRDEEERLSRERTDAGESNAQDAASGLQRSVDGATATAEDLLDSLGGLPGWLPGAIGEWRRAAAGSDYKIILEDGRLELSQLTLAASRAREVAGAFWLRLNGRRAPVGSAVAVTAAQAALPRPLSEAEASEIRRGELVAEADVLERKLSEAAARRERALRGAGGKSSEGSYGFDRLARARLAGEMRQMDDDVSATRRSLAVPLIEAELERVYSELESEALDFAEAVPRSDEEGELLLAEFGLLDAKAAELRAAMDEDQALSILDEEITMLAVELPSLRDRLGLARSSVLVMSAEDQVLRARTLVRRSVIGVEEGIEFYARGTRMLVEDLGYCGKLVGKAVMGTTLRPREVLALRRTATDLLALPVCTVILIIPLTPVGHVLVFSFIQRVFPGFFPSQFSEERQETYKLYEAAKAQLGGENGEGFASDANGAAGAAAQVQPPDEVTAALARAMDATREGGNSRGGAKGLAFDDVLAQLETDVLTERDALAAGAGSKGSGKGGTGGSEPDVAPKTPSGSSGEE